MGPPQELQEDRIEGTYATKTRIQVSCPVVDVYREGVLVGSRMEPGVGQVQDLIQEVHWDDWVSRKVDHILVISP